MTNAPFKDINDFKDIESLNFWTQTVLPGGMDQEEALKALRFKSRDNARTPMQWDSTDNAGFTSGHPWINVNPNYKEINAEESLKDPDSVFHYYHKLIEVRKQHDVIVYGTYEIYFPDDPNLYVYTRTLGNSTLFIALNFTKDQHQLTIPDGLNLTGAKLIISNYNNSDVIPTNLRSYEAIVYLKE